ncbi:MAG: DUF5131 family protein [Candidatus Bathyarchaeota archaeon]|nr:DUF5131 family protein [Candidatus Bathyarchaeum tardum]
MTTVTQRKKGTKLTLGTKEWADHNVNCINGCYNDCRYCYAKVIAKRFGRCTDETWKEMHVQTDKITKSFSKKSGRVMFPSTHDIFESAPYKEACFSVLEKLLSNSNEVLITTKPRFNIIEQISDQFNRYKSQIQFRFTITSNNNNLLSFWEPNAPSYEERLASLQLAFRRGFKTSVSIEPFLDFNPIKLIEEINEYTTESIWVGRMNYIKRNNLLSEELPYYRAIRRNYSDKRIFEIYNKLYNKPKIRIKDSITNQLSRANLI